MGHKTDTDKGLRLLFSNRIVQIAASLVIAVLVWVFYTSTYGAEITRTFEAVPVKYSGEDTLRDSLSLIITDEEYTSVTVTVSGPRRELLKLTSADLSAVVDLSTVNSAATRYMYYTLKFPSSVNMDDITIEEQTPRTLPIVISKLITKTIPVYGSFTGTVSDGYVYDQSGLTFAPASISVSGPQEELDSISCAYVSVYREGVSAGFTVDCGYTLLDADGDPVSYDDLQYDTTVVSATVPINMTKEISLDVDLVEGGGATESDVIVTVSPSVITLSGDAETLNGINRISLATIDLSDYSAFPDTNYVIRIPNDTVNLSGDTNATVSLEFTGLESALYNVTNLEVINVPDGYEATIMSTSLIVTIRAPEGMLSSIESNSIRAVADLTGATATSLLPVKIYVDGFAEAGAVGDYTMWVKIRSLEDNTSEAAIFTEWED